MDHEAYEKEMIDTVNRHAKEKRGQFTSKRTVITKKDTATLKMGLKRMLIAILAIVLFALSMCCFIATATATGYLAVVLFITAIVLAICSFVFLYAQGITNVESQGDSK